MWLSALAAQVVERGLLTSEAVAEASRRQRLYGGSLDTALLELKLLDEATLAVLLSELSGCKPWISPGFAGLSSEVGQLMEEAEALRLGAVPLARTDQAIDVGVGPLGDPVGVTAWGANRGIVVDVYVLPEVIQQALFCIAYGRPLAPRFSRLLGRMSAGDRLRRAVIARTVPPSQASPPRVSATSPPPVDLMPTRSGHPEVDVEMEDGDEDVTAPMAIPPPATPSEGEANPDPVASWCLQIDSGPRSGRYEALCALRLYPEDPRVAALVESLLAEGRSEDPGVALRALADLRDLRHPGALPGLIDRLRGKESACQEAAHRALVEITKQDFGRSPWRWLVWWQKARHKHRMEWLMDALGHARPALRLAAAEELRTLTGEYLGYHFDLPKRDREEARRRWNAWWIATGRARFAWPPSRPG